MTSSAESIKSPPAETVRSDSARLLRAGIHLVMFLIGVVMLVQLLGVIHLQEGVERKDWSHLWLGGRMVVSGHATSLYDSKLQIQVYRESDSAGQKPAVWKPRHELMGCFFYPPPTSLYYACYAWLPMRTAAILHGYMSLIFVVAAAVLIARVHRKELYALWVVVAMLMYPPLFSTLILGQNSALTLLMIAGLYFTLLRGQDRAAGFLLALMIYKPNWCMSLIWIPLLMGRWRVFVAAGVGVVVLCGGTWIVMGTQPFVDYLQVARQLTGLHQFPGYNLTVQFSGLSVLRRWFGFGPTSSNLHYLGCAVLVLIAWWLWRQRGSLDVPHRRWWLCAAILIAMWVNPHLYYYDLLPMGLPIILMLCDWRNQDWTGKLVMALLLFVCFAALPLEKLLEWKGVLPLPTVAIGLLLLWYVFRSLRRNKNGAAKTHSQCVA